MTKKFAGYEVPVCGPYIFSETLYLLHTYISTAFARDNTFNVHMLCVSIRECILFIQHNSILEFRVSKQTVPDSYYKSVTVR